MRIACILSICEADKDIAQGALDTLLQALEGYETEVFVVDDASPSNAGRMLVDRCGGRGVRAHLHRLDRPLGPYGAARRTFLLLHMVSQSGHYDLTIKVDPDTLITRRGLGDLLEKYCLNQPGVHGLLSRMQSRYRMFLLADLLPLGLKRRVRHGMMQRAASLNRFKVVWGARWRWRAFTSGYRFQYCSGAFYVIHAETLREAAQAGYLANSLSGEDGLVTGYEDVSVAMLSAAVGHPLHNLNDAVPGFGTAFMTRAVSVEQVWDAGAYVVHPLKDIHDPRRQRLLDAMNVLPPADDVS